MITITLLCTKLKSQVMPFDEKCNLIKSKMDETLKMNGVEKGVAEHTHDLEPTQPAHKIYDFCYSATTRSTSSYIVLF